MSTAIITTVFNEENNIERFLISILSQSVVPDTVVIVDGGSKDETFTKAQNFSKDFKEKGIELVLKSQLCNIAQGRNIAISATDADIICVTDAGVILYPNWFYEISTPLLKNKLVDCVSGNFEIGGNNGVQNALKVVGYKNKATNNPSSRSFAFRRHCWERYSYPEHLKVHEDTKLCNEWHRLGYQFEYSPDASVVWIAEDTLPKLYRKYAQYAVWASISGDPMDMMRKLQISTYVLAFIASFYTITYGISVVLTSLIVRLIRQYIRANKNLNGIYNLKNIHWAILVQFTLDAAAIIGTIQGYSRSRRK